MNKHANSGIMKWMMGIMFKHMPGMLTCKEFDDFVLDYFDGTLSNSQNKQFSRHLRLCRACRAYIKAYRRSIEISQAVFPVKDEPLPDDVPEDLIKTILKLRDN